ncbi:hypothetical protein FBY30_1200 [Arthrobacter sp. SLBN-83]|uniref:hypothetical protein n=1 Tax=Arthrobacter sp. SLBN-83 TaxID=2768449 RepID=UPI001154A973|nr:hypothetical protein [Arthrobacter sp. SLBN-83]TQJ58963.1 hypothetical protein FBY30_1200 [Arthrobacter sp. SLBN-83]
MTFRPAVASAAALSTALLLLTGCGTVGEAAGTAVSEAASKAASSAAQEVTRQICAVVDNGLVSPSDRQALAGLASAARTAGVPVEITTPLNRIAEAGDQVPEDSVRALKDACHA